MRGSLRRNLIWIDEVPFILSYRIVDGILYERVTVWCAP